MHSGRSLRAVTLSAAEILQIDQQLGSLTPGKDATLLIVTGNLLETESNVIDAYIQGRQVDLGSRHKMLNQKYQKKYSQRQSR